MTDDQTTSDRFSRMWTCFGLGCRNAREHRELENLWRWALERCGASPGSGGAGVVWGMRRVTADGLFRGDGTDGTPDDFTSVSGLRSRTNRGAPQGYLTARGGEWTLSGAGRGPGAPGTGRFRRNALPSRPELVGGIFDDFARSFMPGRSRFGRRKVGPGDGRSVAVAVKHCAHRRGAQTGVYEVLVCPSGTACRLRWSGAPHWSRNAPRLTARGDSAVVIACAAGSDREARYEMRLMVVVCETGERYRRCCSECASWDPYVAPLRGRATPATSSNWGDGLGPNTVASRAANS